jgi:hypothetical protein
MILDQSRVEAKTVEGIARGHAAAQHTNCLATDIGTTYHAENRISSFNGCWLQAGKRWEYIAVLPIVVLQRQAECYWHARLTGEGQGIEESRGLCCESEVFAPEKYHQLQSPKLVGRRVLTHQVGPVTYFNNRTDPTGCTHCRNKLN